MVGTATMLALCLPLMVGGAEGSAALQRFLDEYPKAAERLLDLYGHGTFTIDVEWPRRDDQARVRIFLRWPLVRYDRLSPSANSVVLSSYIRGHRWEYRVRRLPEAGSYVLRYRREAQPMERIWEAAANEGDLPLTTVGFFAGPVVDYVREQSVRIVDARQVELDGRQAVLVETVEELSGRPVRGKFWFYPDLGWVLAQWHWPIVSESSGFLCTLEYGETVDGVGIVERGQLRRASDETVVVWRARIVSYDLTAPSEQAFHPAVFGLPEPAPDPPASRLWLWTLVGVAGILTALLLMRLVTRRRPAARRPAAIAVHTWRTTEHSPAPWRPAS